MAYVKTIWECGDPISVQALNKMEQGIYDANQGGSGGEVGYECLDDATVIFDGIATTASQMGMTYGFIPTSVEFPIDGNLYLTYNGTTYKMPKAELSNNSWGYGEFIGSSPSFTNIPFALMDANMGDPNQLLIASQTSGDYTITITLDDATVETTECFDKARGYSCKPNGIPVVDQDVTTSSQEVSSATLNVGQFTFLPFDESQVDEDPLFTVIFNGVEYNHLQADSNSKMGADIDTSTMTIDWSTYPFLLILDGCTLITETAGTYSLYIETEASTTIEVSECFKEAVKSITAPLIVDLDNSPNDATCSNGVVSTANISFQEIKSAFLQGRRILFRYTASNYVNEYFPIVGIREGFSAAYALSTARELLVFEYFSNVNGDAMYYPKCMS